MPSEILALRVAASIHKGHSSRPEERRRRSESGISSAAELRLCLQEGERSRSVHRRGWDRRLHFRRGELLLRLRIPPVHGPHHRRAQLNSRLPAREDLDPHPQLLRSDACRRSPADQNPRLHGSEPPRLHKRRRDHRTLLPSACGA
uniref:Uncharacterized protein n=1 Tax=Steinernema glaseri TaxID=37863 RepID=A0A1I8AV78_9BILA